ncbi:MAG: hypothetical protein Q9178_004561 [Gyalolechia marmorata]
MPSQDPISNHDKDSGASSRSKKGKTAYEFEGSGLGEVKKKISPDNPWPNHNARGLQRSSTRKVAAFDNWRRLRRGLYVTRAWKILGDPERRRQYHERLGLSGPPGETRLHESHATDEKAVLSEDTTSDGGTIICQDPEWFLDDPFIEGRKSPLLQRTTKLRDARDKTTGASAMPRMGIFRTKAEEAQAATPRARILNAHRIAPVRTSGASALPGTAKFRGKVKEGRTIKSPARRLNVPACLLMVSPKYPAAVGQQPNKSHGEKGRTRSDFQATWATRLARSAIATNNPKASSAPTINGTIAAEVLTSGDDDTILDVEEASTRDDRQLDATRNRAQSDDMILAYGGKYPTTCKRPLPEDDDTVSEDEEIRESRGTKARWSIH